MNNSFLVDEKGFYGEFGGAYVPEILYATVENLRREYLPIIESEDFRKEYALCDLSRCSRCGASARFVKERKPEK